MALGRAPRRALARGGCIRQTSTSTSGGGGAARGRSRRRDGRWRPANVLREAPQGTGVLVYGNLPVVSRTVAAAAGTATGGGVSGQPHRDGGGLPEPVVLAEHGGVRTFLVLRKQLTCFALAARWVSLSLFLSRVLDKRDRKVEDHDEQGKDRPRSRPTAGRPKAGRVGPPPLRRSCLAERPRDRRHGGSPRPPRGLVRLALPMGVERLCGVRAARRTSSHTGGQRSLSRRRRRSRSRACCGRRVPSVARIASSSLGRASLRRRRGRCRRRCVARPGPGYRVGTMTVLLALPTRLGGAFGSVCPGCGGLLDAPRLNPATGRSARKCELCGVWYGFSGGRRPARGRLR